MSADDEEVRPKPPPKDPMTRSEGWEDRVVEKLYEKIISASTKGASAASGATGGGGELGTWLCGGQGVGDVRLLAITMWAIEVRSWCCL
jgi:hypothetical protein